MTDEKFRLGLHLTPPTGWMNDPNGLIKTGDEWHVFYQHDPESLTHGRMHWGHASTKDFLNWQHHPIALRPEGDVECFSGSAIELDNGEIKLVFTDHMYLPDGSDFENQSLVHADLEQGRFDLDRSNPILSNNGPGVFRDPKVIWHEASSRWIMLITLGQEIGIYSSSNLIDWQFESRFGEGRGFHNQAPWECPDLIELTTPDGETAWVLVVGVTADESWMGSATQYFVGDFDGHQFIDGNPSGTVLWVDNGRDFYATQSFFSREDTPPVLMGWASNWKYAKSTPTKAFRGSMSHPRVVSLARTTEGLRLVQTLPLSIRDALPEVVPNSGASAPDAYRFSFELNPGDSLTLFGADEPQLIRSGDGTCLNLHRTEPWAVEIAPQFNGRHAFECDAGPVRGEAYVDKGLVEFALCDGRIWATQLHFPDRLNAVPTITRGSEYSAPISNTTTLNASGGTHV